jgi:Trk-type K+ transport system membrane component
VLTFRFRATYDDTWAAAAWHGVFHSVIAGGIGFPVLFELRRRWHTPNHWSVHTRLTLYGSLIMLVAGIASSGSPTTTAPSAPSGATSKPAS